jgi:hypothetical protein
VGWGVSNFVRVTREYSIEDLESRVDGRVFSSSMTGLSLDNDYYGS